MSVIMMFLPVFLPAFAGSAIGFTILWLARRGSRGGCPPLVGPKSFPEVLALPEEERRRVLQAAGREAFPGWRRAIPIGVFSALFAIGASLGNALPMLAPVPQSVGSTGTTAVAAGLLGGFAAWLVRRMIKRAMKRALAKQLQATAQRAA
jgi:hypothetical protein